MFLRQVGTSDSDGELFHSLARSRSHFPHYLYLSIFACSRNAPTVIPIDFSVSALLLKFALGVDNSSQYLKRFSTRISRLFGNVKRSHLT
ncbi:hypothetical protein QT970_02185 [Microcoleus sp. herbarium8]|uniref:hypothetical protein n=1 Tax=Microcoleus sp. herbarium8 TaxID=3055436 RepID=UPI002FCEE1B3